MHKTEPDKLEVAAKLIKELFVDQRKVMNKWALVTGQTPQLDSGYIAQHLISLLTGKKGSGFRGKGLDLEDGSEVKCACSVDGVDVPRWNHNLRSQQKVEEWLQCPSLYYVLFDTETRDASRIRVRIWTVEPRTDEAYQNVLRTWAASDRKSDNFQLHPPVRKDGNLATNESGDLDLPLMFQADEGEDDYITVRLYKEENLPSCVLHPRIGTHDSNGKKTRSKNNKKTPVAETLRLPIN